jgi:hypothetical protein
MRSILSTQKLLIYLVTYDRGLDKNGVKKREHWAIFIAKSPGEVAGHTVPSK